MFAGLQSVKCVFIKIYPEYQIQDSQPCNIIEEYKDSAVVVEAPAGKEME